MKGVLKYGLLSLPVMMLMGCGGDSVKKAVIKTEFGNMTVELYNSTPIHKANFIKHVKAGYYDDLLFHRVIPTFMIQGGDPNSKNAAPGQRLGTGGPGYTIDAEIGAPHFRGTLAAARTGGASNPEKRSSGSQFYIIQGQQQTEQLLDQWAQRKGIEYNEDQIEKYKSVGGRPDLDAEYTVFGQVVDGFEVIDKIAQVQRDGADRPVSDVKMTIKMLN